MAVAIDNSSTYDSGGYTNNHTLSAFQCNGTDSHLVVGVANRNFSSEVTGATADGNTMTLRSGSAVDNNSAGVGVFDYTISSASFDIVVSTPTYKLAAVMALALSGVDQTTATAGTPVTTTGWGTSATASYTGTSGNMLLVFINTQNARTLTASNCTESLNADHPDANLGQYFAGYVTATGSSQTIGATLNSGDNYAVSIVEVAASAGAPSSPTLVRAAIII